MNIKPESKTFINLAKFFIPFIIGLGVIAGAITGGRIADLRSRKRSVYISLLVTTSSFILFVIPVSWFILLVFAFLLGKTIFLVVSD